ncbi:hypothetical protein JOB18_029850 [Solea senegalensis]|uniref:Uncharacterized protein n=1 Tax=Solea senegalensis TaxID=28829 RepID=A0AAV6QYX5_SOLSE|nr:hypothetical protein JOB18_029850 [Solea senegalensis]
MFVYDLETTSALSGSAVKQEGFGGSPEQLSSPTSSVNLQMFESKKEAHSTSTGNRHRGGGETVGSMKSHTHTPQLLPGFYFEKSSLVAMVMPGNISAAPVLV